MSLIGKPVATGVFVSRLRVRPIISWLALVQVLIAIVVGTVTRDVHIESIPMQRVGSTN